MKELCEAVFEHGAFRLLSPAPAIRQGQKVHLVVEECSEGEPDALEVAKSVFDGLPDLKRREIEAIILDRRRFLLQMCLFFFACVGRL